MHCSGGQGDEKGTSARGALGIGVDGGMAGQDSMDRVERCERWRPGGNYLLVHREGVGERADIRRGGEE